MSDNTIQLSIDAMDNASSVIAGASAKIADSLKLVVNVPMRELDRFLCFPKEPKYPQTRILKNTFETMLHTYRLEAAKGVFDVPDGNFERFLSVSAKLLANIAERDR
jgi:hypothetical protein